MKKSDEIPSLHDFLLLKVDISESPSLIVFSFKASDGRFFDLKFFDCKVFRIIDVKFDNIVSRLVIYKGAGFDSDELRSVIEFASSSSDSGSYLCENSFNQYLSDISKGVLMAAYIEPSDGCEAAIVCRDMTLEAA